MLKKNTRKRLLAGALATVMMLTMCPSWALADDDGITPLPLVDENRPVAESAPVEADTTETPAVPTPSEPEAKPAEDQNTAPAPSDDEANGGTDSTEPGNSTNSTVSEGSENISQNDNVVSNAPEDKIASHDALFNGAEAVPAYLSSDVTKTAESWVTNLHVEDLTITKSTVGTGKKGTDVTTLVNTLAKSQIKATDGTTYVFWQARVLPFGHHQSTIFNGDRTKEGTEIDSIRYVERTGLPDYFQYHDKNNDSWEDDSWTKFKGTDQLVFYYLVRTDYSEMVQIDVSDWTVNEEPSYDDRRSVTYQVIIDSGEGGKDNGKVIDRKKFWYNKTFTVSSVRVRQTESKNYTINRVELNPGALGEVKNVDNEYQFSLDLSKASTDEATVNIYVKPNVDPHQLTYVLNDGTIKSAAGTYTPEGSY